MEYFILLSLFSLTANGVALLCYLVSYFEKKEYKQKTLEHLFTRVSILENRANKVELEKRRKHE